MVRSYCHVVSCALAWRGVRCGEAEASDSSGVQHVLAWLRGQPDLDS